MIDIPSLKGQWVELRPLLPPDYQFLYQLAVDPEYAYRWRFRANLPSYEEFLHLLHQGVLVQYLVTKRGGEQLGLVVCYRADLRNRHAYVAMQAVPELIGKGWALQAASLFINYLFTCHDFHKLYVETYEFNLDTFRSGLDWLFTEEACLKDHERFMGRTWDLHILACYRDTWAFHAKHGHLGLGTVTPAMLELDEFEDFARFLERELELKAGILTPETRFELDLGFDSIQMVVMLIALEEKLGAHLDDEALTSIHTAGDAHFHYLQAAPRDRKVQGHVTLPSGFG